MVASQGPGCGFCCPHELDEYRCTCSCRFPFPFPTFSCGWAARYSHRWNIKEFVLSHPELFTLQSGLILLTRPSTGMCAANETERGLSGGWHGTWGSHTKGRDQDQLCWRALKVLKRRSAYSHGQVFRSQRSVTGPSLLDFFSTPPQGKWPHRQNEQRAWP